MTLPPDAGRSWWLRDALADDPGEPAPPLRGDTVADVVILGGGYTGMWTALHLAGPRPRGRRRDHRAGHRGRRRQRSQRRLRELVLGRHRVPRAPVRGPVPPSRSVKREKRASARSDASCETHGIDAWYRADGEYVVAASDDQVGRWADGVTTADRLGVNEHFQVLSPARCESGSPHPCSAGRCIARWARRCIPHASPAGCAACCWSEACGSSRTRRSPASVPGNHRSPRRPAAPSAPTPP